MGVRFDVDAQYSLLDVVGQGAYGVVCAALDEDSGETVAIKKITNAFEHELYAKRTLREIRLLRLLKHDNLIGLKIILPPLKSDGFKDLYIISELMETDLSSIIKSPQPLSESHTQFFLYQVHTSAGRVGPARALPRSPSCPHPSSPASVAACASPPPPAACPLA